MISFKGLKVSKTENMFTGDHNNDVVIDMISSIDVTEFPKIWSATIVNDFGAAYGRGGDIIFEFCDFSSKNKQKLVEYLANSKLIFSDDECIAGLIDIDAIEKSESYVRTYTKSKFIQTLMKNDTVTYETHSSVFVTITLYQSTLF